MSISKLGMIGVLGASLFGFVVACGDDKGAATGGDDDDDNTSSSSSSSSGGSSSSSGGSASASAYATELCARIDRCFPGSTLQSWGDAATCQAGFDKFIAPQKALPGSGMTEGALATCADKFKSADCTLIQNEIPECVFKGTLENDAECTLGVQCKTGFCAYASQTATCGKCAPTVPVGGSCTGFECEVPSFCDADTGKCINAPGASGDCTSFDCSGGLSCVNGKCTTPIAKDGACTAPAVDFENPCAQGFACIDGKCALPAVTAKTGEACAAPKTQCIDGECLASKCVANLKEGAACDASADSPPFCEKPLLCLGGKCTVYEVNSCK